MTDDARYELLRKRYDELAQLAGSLAHEIKNPLSVIRMNVDLLAEDLAEEHSPTIRRSLGKLDTVQGQCTRLENLLNDFLRFARARKLDLLPGQLNTVVDQVLNFFLPQANEQHVDVVRYLDPDLPAILVDQESLHAALLNLVKNALEAMPNGGQLTARTYRTPTGVALDFIDTGIGMDNETALRMFREFYTTKQGGSGLGLPTARKILEGHGGRISVDSDRGRGTKFTMTFPSLQRIEGE
jgi:signal transduction histidine kinase